MRVADIEAIAEATAARLSEIVGSGAMTFGLVDARQFAHELGVSLDFVYRHAGELGAIRLGAGERPRLRFDPAVVRERWASVHAPPPDARTRRCRPSIGEAPALLSTRDSRLMLPVLLHQFRSASPMAPAGQVHARGQPRRVPSAAGDGLGSGRRIIRNELNRPMSPARIGIRRAI